MEYIGSFKFENTNFVLSLNRHDDKMIYTIFQSCVPTVSVSSLEELYEELKNNKISFSKDDINLFINRSIAKKQLEKEKEIEIEKFYQNVDLFTQEIKELVKKYKFDIKIEEDDEDGIFIYAEDKNTSVQKFIEIDDLGFKFLK